MNLLNVKLLNGQVSKRANYAICGSFNIVPPYPSPCPDPAQTPDCTWVHALQHCSPLGLRKLDQRRKAASIFCVLICFESVMASIEVQSEQPLCHLTSHSQNIQEEKLKVKDASVLTVSKVSK